jgi:hypothetical protein
MGQHGWGSGSARSGRTMIDKSVVDAFVERLTNPANTESAATFPSGRAAIECPGLYSWWADDEALETLHAVFGVRMPSLIYAGQAGATSTRSRRTRSATLRSRISSNHLSGNVSSSTFRKTITAVLVEPLDLQLSGSDCLDRSSNETVSVWMRARLRLVTAPCQDRDRLAEVEHAILERIDPPLNLMGMPSTPLRTKLRDLRSRLG